jgi:hypothetical protein
VNFGVDLVGFSRVCARELLDDGLLGKVAVGVVVVVVELEEAQTGLGAFAAQRRGAALGPGESGDIGLIRLGDGGKGLGRERLLRDGRGEGEEVHEGLAIVQAAGRHGDGWSGGRFFLRRGLDLA